MEKINWKIKLRDTLAQLLYDMYLIFCVLAVTVIVATYQTKQTWIAIKTLIDCRDWAIIIVFMVGLAYLSFALKKVITMSSKLIFGLLKILFKKN